MEKRARLKRLDLDQRWGEKGVARTVAVALSVLLAAFLAYLLVHYKWYTYLFREDHQPDFLPLVVAGACCLFLCCLLHKRLKTAPTAVILLAAFALALLPRLALRFYAESVPFNDSSNYYALGRAFLGGEYATIQRIVGMYGIFDFYGLAVLNGVTMAIFGESVYAFQLAHCVYSSLIAVMICLIGMQYSRSAGIAAGMIFALYPDAVVLAQVPSNQHLAILFALAAMYLIICAVKQERLARSAILSACGGLCLLISQYAHPSSITTLIAITCYLIVLLLSALRDKRRLIRLACVLGAFLLLYLAGDVGVAAALRLSGVAPAEGSMKQDFWFKLLVGMNPETQGGYSAQIASWDFGATPDARRAFALAKLKEFWPSTDGMWAFFDSKIRRVWIAKPNLGWWSDGIAPLGESNLPQAIRQQTFVGGLMLYDFVYVAAIHLFAFFGVCLHRRKTGMTDLITWSILGWVAVHLISEVMQRYRYYGMTMLIVFAAIGIGELCGLAKLGLARVKEKRSAPKGEAPTQPGGGEGSMT